MAHSVPSLPLHQRPIASPLPDASRLAFSSSRLLPRSSLSLPLSSCANYSSAADLGNPRVCLKHRACSRRRRGVRRLCASSSREVPLKVIISGAPDSGKGTQCELITKKYGLVHISTGDLLRAEVSSGTKIGLMVKTYMENGLLVPDDIVTDIVKARLSQQDAKERGWLLDGYPRTLPQAQSLENSNIRPDIFLLLDVKARIEAYNKNVEAVSSVYADVLIKIDGNCPKELVFESIDSFLKQIKNDKVKMLSEDLLLDKATLDRSIHSDMASLRKDNWRGIPTRLNNIPHSKDIREYFYDDVLQATRRAVEDKQTRLKVEINIPELNPEMDVYRIGTLMELVRVLALSFADDGKYVKVCVQGSMGEGALSGMPLQLAGSRRILEFMDWGEHGALGTFVNIGSIGAKDVSKQDDIFIIMAPQNAVGNCIIDELKALTDEAGDRPVILVNPRLKDLPSSSGIMQAMGRDKRLEYASAFQNCYLFRLLYYAGTQYPIMAALRMSYPYRYELYRRVDESFGKERYVIISTFPERPTPEQINDTFEGKPRDLEKSTSGFWGFLSSIF